MATRKKKGSGYLYKRGDAWWFEYTKDGERKRVSLGVVPQAEAERARATLILSTSTVPTAVEKVLVHALAEERKNIYRHPLATAWEERPYIYSSRGNARRELKPWTMTQNRQCWANFIKFMADKFPNVLWMEEVETKHGAEWVKWMVATGAGARLIKVRLGVVSVMYRMASLPDPFARVPRIQGTTVSRRAFTDTEIEHLVESATSTGPEWRVLVLLGIYTGMRLGDCATLRWEDVDLIAGVVSRVTAKTSSRVALPIHQFLRKALSELPRAESGIGPVVPDLARRYSSVTTQRRFMKNLKGIFIRAGIQTRVDVEGRASGASIAGFHALRHSFVTACARSGIHEGVVRQWVGHGSLMVTRIYTHWRAADAAGINKALPDFG